ncbi:NUDIX domain-containing protein [Cryobacterium sp. TMT1-21]|uniref:NUDIX domain-containing protein n=1 Tax=Cryobacterium sp. TMT1-21 TaxID=1259234 RepID=UPI0010693780|nr:NUDIX domain-containing protein [Cryobacterium sp. TMT1-21]TFD14571.1 NUDIX domain-containing protein [Cryobacterium sp. TMT1-21]
MKKRIEVVGAVLTRGETILAAQRSSTMSLPGMWEFPGGKIESNESPQQALLREPEFVKVNEASVSLGG